jgi:hypothetical protein
VLYDELGGGAGGRRKLFVCLDFFGCVHGCQARDQAV